MFTEWRTYTISFIGGNRRLEPASNDRDQLSLKIKSKPDIMQISS